MTRRKGLDFARAVGAIGIVAFHFYCHSNSANKLFLNFANGSWGHALNFLFFAMSGYVLQMRYGIVGKLNVRDFYYRRWKSTIPAYLVVFSYVVLINIFTYGQIFYMPIPKVRMILALTGIDSYLNWIIPTYSTVGEWFLGAILIAYMVYPLLRYLLQKARCFLLIVLLGACLLFLKVDFLGFPYFTNPFVFIFCFYIGMLLADHLIGRKCLAVSIIICLCVFIIPKEKLGISGSDGLETALEMLAGICLMIILMEFGEYVCANMRIGRWVSFVSGLSYYTFLIHHSIIYKVLGGFNPTSTVKSCILLCVVIALTLVFSKILDVVMKQILGSDLFLKLEQVINKELYPKTNIERKKGCQK